MTTHGLLVLAIAAIAQASARVPLGRITSIDREVQVNQRITAIIAVPPNHASFVFLRFYRLENGKPVFHKDSEVTRDNDRVRDKDPVEGVIKLLIETNQAWLADPFSQGSVRKASFQAVLMETPTEKPDEGTITSSDRPETVAVVGALDPSVVWSTTWTPLVVTHAEGPFKPFHEGEVAWVSGNHASAVRWFETSLTTNPDLYAGHLYLAVHYDSAGDRVRASKHYVQYASRLPVAAEPAYGANYVAAVEHNDPEALARLETAVASDNENAAAHYGLGIAYLKLGRKDRARGHFEEYLKLDPRGASAELAKMLLEIAKK